MTLPPFVNDPLSVFILNNKVGPLGLESARYFTTSSVVNNADSIREIRKAMPNQRFVLKRLFIIEGVVGV